MDYKRIIAHTDLDGVASASMCLLLYGNKDITFAGPTEINMRKISISEDDIIVDLPYGTPSTLWYDHHTGNTDDVKLLGIDPDTIPGKRLEYPSCAGLIYDTFKDSFKFPAFIPELIEGVNRVDSFNYKDIEDWRRETPDRIIDLAIKTPFDSRNDQYRFLRELAHLFTSRPAAEIAQDQDIQAKYKATRENEDKMIKIIDRELKVLDEEKKILLLDLSEYKYQMRLNRSLAFLKEPEAHVVIAIMPVFYNGVKSTDLMFSMSLAIKAPPTYDLGDIVRSLNIGDGHKGAASGKLESKGKQEMLKNRDKMVQTILSYLKG